MARPATTELNPREIRRHEEIASYLEAAWPDDLPWTHFPAGERHGDEIERPDGRGGTYRFSPTGARLKRMGLHKGWFDLQFVLPNAQFATAEVKRENGKFSDDQKGHRRKLIALGAAVARWETVEDAAETITFWLAAFQRKPLCTLAEWRARR